MKLEIQNSYRDLFVNQMDLDLPAETDEDYDDYTLFFQEHPHTTVGLLLTECMYIDIHSLSADEWEKEWQYGKCNRWVYEEADGYIYFCYGADDIEAMFAAPIDQVKRRISLLDVGAFPTPFLPHEHAEYKELAERFAKTRAKDTMLLGKGMEEFSATCATDLEHAVIPAGWEIIESRSKPKPKDPSHRHPHERPRREKGRR